ncbi:zinc finger CCHC domain-containing protein 14 isoform X2 [Sinocyclocheilus rhinocerous]|uniref:zinc finger CCHC domain-containing protein 14 isoform X2 n=1 Tax=Sinocyclocheilus rhinocerous TaxID=307959 RepID=UPI0007B7938C|nr:PREDICTED: zinc finger CCHC domain-containing protein 14-like isoform X2 [Sinocyclocheilus rhinocerous]
MVENRCFVQREEVYRWFSALSSAQRAEFLCGILDLCVPIELRFLGSCLEDLARKDYHSLRDAEIKANNPADLANLANITDEVVRSKLLVSLALLSSDNRVAAGVLFRTLTHIDTIINNYGLQLNDGQTGEQFMLLFTMASNHPAFSFHQKQVLRQELTQIQEILQVTVGEAPSTSHGGGASAAALPNVSATPTFPSYITTSTFNSCQVGCPCCKNVQREVTGGQTDEGLGPEVMLPSQSLLCQEMPLKVHVGKPSKVYIERIELRGVTPKSDKPTEYVLEALWSDSTLSTVSKTPHEVVEFISQLSQLFPDECLEKLLPQMPGLDSTYELDPRCLTSLPPQVLKHDKVHLFFSTSPAPQLPTSTNLGCLLQYRGARPICGVASIQPVLSVHAPLPQSSPAHLPPLPSQTAVAILPGTAVPMGESSPPQTHLTIPAPQPQAQSQQPCPEQNGILDWLRKLRLHKYYPVFKQLTMEEFLALTEEDLNKYDLTQGAKKKLKTQLELQKEKLEKRYVVSEFPVSCSGVARVTPSSHIGPLTHAHTESELRVDVENSSLPIPRDSSSSSGYSSAPSSPMTPLSRDTSFDRVKDLHRRLYILSGFESGLDPGEKERSGFLLNPAVSTGPSRPTAQVLPVQNDPSLCPSQMNLPPPSLPLLSPGRIINSPRKLRPPPLCSEERPKPIGSGVTVGVRLENIFPGLNLDGSPRHQDVSGPRGPLTVLRSPPGLMVETSTALTSTSNTLHHVSHPPLHLQVSFSVPRTGSYPLSTPSSCPSSSSSTRPTFSPVSGVPIATASNVPMAAVPGNTYCVNSTPTVTPSSSPASTENSGYASVQANSANSSSSLCVCSSCGCSGNCGSYGALPFSYAGYFPHPFSGTSLFTLGPLLHFSPLLTGSGTASPFSYPLVAPPIYNSSLSHDSQQNLVLPPVQGFLGGGGGVYQPHGMMGNGSSGHKKTGNVSCYNCGLSGHRAQDCKQPAMDSAQQGTFRLKYSPQSDSQDSGE